jgi:hypothetical protein
MIALLGVENVDSYVADFLEGFNRSSLGFALFIAIFVAFTVGNFCILNLVNQRMKEIVSRSFLVNSLQKSVTIVQYILIGNIFFIIIQTLSLILFGIQFLAWFRSSSKSIGVLLFGVAFMILAFSEIMAALSDSYLLLQKEPLITSNSKVMFYDFPEGSFFNHFFDYYDYLDYASFFLILVASALLLHNYGRRINKIKLALIMFLPIVSYTSSMLDALNIYDTDTNPDLFSYYIFQSLTTLSGGILFAICFYYVARKLPPSRIRTFLTITALGFVLLYLTNTVTVSIASYPPFTINSLSLLPLSSYLVLMGLYASALFLSRDDPAQSIKVSVRYPRKTNEQCEAGSTCH